MPETTQAQHEAWFYKAAEVAKRALCLRAKCGAVLVLNGEIIGEGFNAPPLDDIAHRKCELDLRESPKKPKADRTCCIHAEWRAITSAIRARGDISGSVLYFTRVDEAGNLLKSGAPYCTVCSRLALDCGVAYFGLWHADGIKMYDTFTYNELSYAFHLQK